ncbi:MAG: 2OG-Fe dioxygenase family protein [Alphaproteobacteria bacterium]|nr:2OG-Fe dioxygenase family protein [Alphaproteobacteria bacterium]
MDLIEPELLSNSFAFRPGAVIQRWLGPGWTDWEHFAVSWNALGEDRHMADGGRYRRRRYAVFDVTRNGIVRAPHQPHFQAKTYNRLNGDLDRWFDPVMPEIGNHPIITTLIERLTSIFVNLTNAEASSVGWHIELHQFRIEARADAVDLPTPEGTYRDGVDGAFVMLINRENVSSGITHVSDAKGRSLG